MLFIRIRSLLFAPRWRSSHCEDRGEIHRGTLQRQCLHREGLSLGYISYIRYLLFAHEDLVARSAQRMIHTTATARITLFVTGRSSYRGSKRGHIGCSARRVLGAQRFLRRQWTSSSSSALRRQRRRGRRGSACALFRTATGTAVTMTTTEECRRGSGSGADRGSTPRAHQQRVLVLHLQLLKLLWGC